VPPRTLSRRRRRSRRRSSLHQVRISRWGDFTGVNHDVQQSYRPPTPPLPKHSRQHGRLGSGVIQAGTSFSSKGVRSMRFAYVPCLMLAQAHDRLTTMDVPRCLHEDFQTASGPNQNEYAAIPYNSSRDPSYKTVKTQSSNIGLSTFQSDLEYEFLDNTVLPQFQFSRRSPRSRSSGISCTISCWWDFACRYFAITVKRFWRIRHTFHTQAETRALS
jgi:hypothetical protein